MTATTRIGLPEAAERLGVHYMTVYRYVRTGQLPAVREGAKWSVDIADLNLAKVQRPTTSPSDGHTTERTSRLFDRLSAGDGPGAWSIVEGAMASGSDPTTIYLDVLTPALRAIGDGWRSNAISIAQEHRASIVATQIVGRLGTRFTRRGRSRGSVVLGLAPGDQHALTSLMLADFVRHAGFEPLNLGANTPARAFVETALGADRLVAVLVGATAGDQDEHVREVTTALHDARVTAPVLVGGRAIRDDEHARLLGGDGWTGRDAASAVVTLERLTTRAH